MGVLSNNRSQITNGGLISASFVSDLYDVFTGNTTESINITGSVAITGSLIATASYASNALSSSYATTASYATTGLSSSFATTASYASNTIQGQILELNYTYSDFTSSASTTFNIPAKHTVTHLVWNQSESLDNGAASNYGTTVDHGPYTILSVNTSFFDLNDSAYWYGSNDSTSNNLPSNILSQTTGSITLTFNSGDHTTLGSGSFNVYATLQKVI